MTKPKPKPGVEPTCLYPREDEVAKLVMGTRSVAWVGLAHVLERKGLPPVDPLFGGRYWPAVREWFDRRNHVGRPNSKPDGEETWNVGKRARDRKVAL